MFETWLTIFHLFSRKEKIRFYIIVFNAVILSLLDIAGFASAMPFVAVAINPEVIQTNSYINHVYSILGFTSEKGFLAFLGSFAFVLLIFVKALYILDARFALRFWYEREYVLSKQLLEHYLNQQYAFFLERNTAELSKIVLSDVTRAVNHVLMSSVELLASITGTIFLLLILVIVDPLVAFATLIFFGGTYITIFLLISKKIKNLGKEIMKHETEMHKRIKEALDGIKEIKILGRERFYSDRFAQAKHSATTNMTVRYLLSLFPPNILEAVAFGGIIMVTVYFTIYADNSGYALSLVALYAFAAYRILPYLKSIFDGFGRLQYNTSAVKQMLRDFPVSLEVASESPSVDNNLILTRYIELRNISYRYPASEEYTIKNLNIKIQANSLTCFFGKSGTGKTTTIDIILGLLTPCEGELAVDDTVITRSNVRAWQKKIGHVSHFMFLTDDTIAENIAFGVSKEEIDYDKVIEVAKTACIHEFISEQMSKGYSTRVGDKGIRLSAGQRQRICIARALYRNPDVIVFDEATNALDKSTENTIIDTLIKLKENITIIIISHKPALAKKSDSVIVLEKGRLVGQGNYNELIDTNEHFRNMIKDT